MRDPEFQDRPELPLHIKGEEGKPRLLFWQRMSRGMEVVIYLLLLLAVLKIFGPELDRQAELKAEATRLTQIQADKEEQVARLRQEHRLLKTDKEYLESIARDRLNLQREGEYVIRLQREEEE
ncbi:MAG: septum formation initiator family protein [Verrucomicrobiales bacterium]|jgi:cell division protein FtsB|nr:septum formation initiator family protein [Verrucomicrobiales bacterium]